MSGLHWFRVGGSPRGMPRRDRSHRKPWPVLGLVACLALLQSGCQSSPFGNCGSGCGSGVFGPCGFFSRVQSRVMNRSSSACCPSGVVTEGPVEYATPAAVVTPATPLTPSYQSGAGTISTPSSVGAPLPGETPSELDRVDPLPKTKVISPPAGNNSQGSLPGNKASYQTRRQDPSTRIARRPMTMPRTTVSTPVPTSRSAQAQPRRAAGESARADDQDPLDHLPPLDLPGEVTKSAATPPVPPAAAQSNKPATGADKAAAAREIPAPAADELDLTSGSSPEGSVGPSATSETGIKRFVAVDLKLAGGSVPSFEGLKWLVDKGYRTVLDLRDSSEVPSTFIAEATRLGLRYIALPVNLQKIDREHVDRFNFEVAVGEARPLFFFDSNGTRAGALWYIRRITSDRMDHQIARREAEGLGLTDQSAWTAATNYVSRLNSLRTSANSPAPAPGEADAEISISLGTLQLDAEPAAATKVASAVPVAARLESNVSKTQTVNPPAPPQAPAQSSAHADKPNTAPADSTASTVPPVSIAWRPFAAMIVSGLAVPLAYLSRTAAPALVSKARASLPGLDRKPKSLHTKSNA